MEQLKRAKEFGIDFGNTKSAVTESRVQHCEFVQTSGGRTTPSIMSFGEGKRVCGDIAQYSQLQYINETVSNMKELLGVKFDSDEKEKIEERVEYELCQMPDNTVGVCFELNGEKKCFSAEQIIAFYLRSISNKEKEGKVDATLAVPCNWNIEKRQRLKNASYIAGVTPRCLVNSTTSAAVNYVISHKERLPKANETPVIAAFLDFGDILATCSIARIRYGSVKVLGSATNSFVTGANITDLMCASLSERIKREFKVDVHKSKRTEFRFRQAVEKVKKALSINSVALLELPSMSDDRDVKLNIERKELVSLIEGAVNTLDRTFANAVEMSGVKISDISIIESFGGTSRIPLIKQAVQNFFGKAPTQSMNADECVALGVGFLAREGFPFIVSDVNQFNISAEWSQGGIRHSSELFKKGCSIPSTHELKLHIGGSKILRLKSDDEDIGTLEVFTENEAPSDVSITLMLSSSSLLEVQSSSVKCELSLNGTLDEEELEELMEKESEMERMDKEEEMIDNSRNRLETVMNVADDALRNARDFIDFSSVEDFEKLLNDTRLWFEMNEFDRMPPSEYDTRSDAIESVADKALKLKRMYEDAQQRARPYLDKVEDLLRRAENESNDQRLIGDLRKEKSALRKYFSPTSKEEPHFDDTRTKRMVRAFENSLAMSKLSGFKH